MKNCQKWLKNGQKFFFSKIGGQNFEKNFFCRETFKNGLSTLKNQVIPKRSQKYSRNSKIKKSVTHFRDRLTDRRTIKECIDIYKKI